MKKTIYINNDEIKVIQGKVHSNEKVKIKNQCVITLPQGSIINGVIMQKEAVLAALVAQRNLLKGAVLFINSSHIVSKKLVLPPLKPQEILSILQKEFTLLEQNEQYVYDYVQYKKENQQYILACAAPEHFLKAYIDLFKEAKIDLKGIDLVVNGVLKWAATQPAIQKKSSIVNIIEQQTMTSLLFEDGEYIFHNKARLVNEPGTLPYVTELFSSLSSMLQFYKSQKGTQRIEASYYVGLAEADANELLRFTNTLEDGILPGVLKLPVQEGQFYGFTGMYKGKQAINLVKAAKMAHKVSLHDRPWFGKTLNLLLLTVLISAAGFWLHTDNKRLLQEITAIENYLISSETVGALSEVYQLQAQALYLEEAVTLINTRIATIEASKMIDGDLLRTLYHLKGDAVVVQDIGYNQLDGTLRIGARGNSVYDASTYVSRLKASGLADDITYEGYALQGEVGYGFTITIVLKGV